MSLKITTVVDKIHPTRSIAKIAGNLVSGILAIWSAVRGGGADILTSKIKVRYKYFLNRKPKKFCNLGKELQSMDGLCKSSKWVAYLTSYLFPSSMPPDLAPCTALHHHAASLSL
jgi:hypothetical protein